MSDPLAPSGWSGGPERPLDIRHLIIDGHDPHPWGANGLHNVAYRLAREQLAAGDRAEVVFLRPPATTSRADGDVPVRILEPEGLRLRGRVVRLAPGVTGALLQAAGRDTIFHIHGGREPLLAGITQALRRLDIPYGMTVHGRYSHLFDREGRVIRRLPVLYLRAVERRILEGARFVQGITRLECALLRQLAPRARIVPIPNAAYSSRLEGLPPAVERGGPSPHFPTFGFCSRYAIVHKGIDLLLGGFALYRNAGGRGRLVLVGSGPERDAVAAMALAQGLGDAVEVHGPRFGEEKRRALADWDFFVLPSRYDVLPTASLEAALQGLPLIASVETGLDEGLLRHRAGFVVSELTAAAVADAMHRAAAVPPDAWRAMSRNVHAMALALGDWTAIAERLHGLYRTARPPHEPSGRFGVSPSPSVQNGEKPL